MIAQLRAELLKLQTTRTVLGLALGMIALVLLICLLQGFVTPAGTLARESEQRSLIGNGGVAILFTALVGLLSITSEFRFGTIRPTLLFSPRRPQMLAAKLGAALLAGLTLGVVAEGLAFALTRVVLSARGIPFVVDGGEAAGTAFGTIGAAVGWAGLGLGVGAIVRVQVGAIVGLLAWMFIAETLLLGLVPSFGRFMPGPASQALGGDTSSHLLDVLPGGLVLAAWVLALAAAGAVLTARRDVD
jgi:ABC-2 type transport system permease protein